MRFRGGISAILCGSAIGIVQMQVAVALTPTEIYAIAQKITVRIDGTSTGSGVIIEREGNNYTVMTNRHVVQEAGSYTVQTSDGKSHQVSKIKKFSDADLAVFQFTSNQNYPVAEKGDSDQVTGGITIHVAGYPQGTSDLQFLNGSISSIVKNPKDGYGWVYAVNAFPGMSGGPILDEQGKLVGIHGRASTRPDTNATTVYGIPLKIYLTLTSTSLPAPVVNPTPPPDKVVTPTPRTSPNVPKNDQSANSQAYFEKGKQILYSDEAAALENFKRYQQLNPDGAQTEGLKMTKAVAELFRYTLSDSASKYDIPKMRAAAVLAPNSDEAWYWLGMLYVKTQQYDNAITVLKTAKTLNLKNADVLFALGQVYSQQQNYPAAVESLQAGLQIRPNEGQQLLLLGFIFHKQGELNEAITQYLKASTQSPKYSSVSRNALNNIGFINYEQGNVAGAIRQWQSVLEANRYDPPVETQLALCVALYSQGERQQSQKLAQQALRRDPRYQNIEFLKQNLWGDRLLGDTKKFFKYLETH